MVERFNRTLKELTYKYMTAHNTVKYEDALPLIVANYNTTIHSATQMAPIDVNARNASSVWQRLMKLRAPLRGYKFRPGDFVRMSKLVGKDKRKGLWGVRALKGVWSPAIYTVTDRHQQLVDGVNYYKLQDWQGSQRTVLRGTVAESQGVTQQMARVESIKSQGQRG